MSQDPLADVRAKIQYVDWMLASGRFPRDGLLDLKGAVDELRNRMWALVTAAGAEEPDRVLARFRVRRAAEMLDVIRQDLLAGHVDRSRPELLGLTAASRELLAAVEDRPAAGM